MSSESIESQLEKGAKNFAFVIRTWMSLNNWSHPKMIHLARAACNNESLLHSSQINSLRNAKTDYPGPKVFFALSRLNKCMYNYVKTKELIPLTISSNYYTNPHAILFNNEAPNPGWWLELFVGNHDLPDVIFVAGESSKQTNLN